MSQPLLYAYGVVRAARRPSIAGRWPRLPAGGRPRVIDLGSTLWLLAADVPADDYGADALSERIADLEWLARSGVAHHDAVARLGRRRTIVPFRLFTVFESEARAVAALARRRRQLERTTERIAGCREWVVRAAIDPSAGRSHPSGRRSDAGRRSGTAYLLERAALRRRDQRPPRGAVTATRALSEDLARFAAGMVRRPPSAEHGVLLDVALLVPRANEHAIRRTIARWSAPLADLGCRIWHTGPWPPYSFVSGGRAAGPASRHG